jgi:DNA-binding response OmpR family regulator
MIAVRVPRPRSPAVYQGAVGRMRAVKVLLVSPDPESRRLMALAVAGVERRLKTPLRFLEATDGAAGLAVAFRERPDAVVADEIASHAGAFSLARDLRGATDPYPGAIVILLDRRHDAWLARWSGADAWFVKPFDPFELADRLVELVVGPRDERESA